MFRIILLKRRAILYERREEQYFGKGKSFENGNG